MWLAISIFIANINEPIKLTQLVNPFGARAECEAHLLEYLDWPDTIFSKDANGAYIKTIYGNGSRYEGGIAYVRCIQVRS